MKFALLLAPSANRVYTQAAPALAEAELKAFGGLEIQPSVVLGGLRYLVFEADLGALPRLVNLSSAYAFFELREDGMLRPIGEKSLDRYEDDLITIPKYAGKTNEHFTKLLLNVTVLASAWAGQLLNRRFTVMDPVAGRGTTLNQVLMYGWNAIGIEIDTKDVDSYAAFLKTYLRRKRMKHRAETTPVRREGKRLGRRFDATINDEQTITLFEADTRLARSLVKARSVDAIVADLPYGIVHGSRTARNLSRSPVDLLSASLEGWIELLRPGAAIGISWNTHVAPREEAVRLLERHGMVVPQAQGGGFEHWVDQGITRDIVVAQKRGAGSGESS